MTKAHRGSSILGRSILLLPLLLTALAAALLPGAREAGLTGAPAASAENVRAVAVSAGAYHTCALMSDGGVKCWGLNDNGQLGDGTEQGSSVPVDVCRDYSTSAGVCLEPLTGAVAIAAGGAVGGHSCAVLQGGSMVCWGDNLRGQLGVDREIDTCTQGFNPPEFTPCSRTPAGVAGLDSGVVDVAIGIDHTCAVMATGGVKCWGWNYLGHLGDGTTTPRSTPVDVVGLDGHAVAVALSYSHTCALLEGGGAACWGRNEAGTLGAQTTELCTDLFLGHLVPCSTTAQNVCAAMDGTGCAELFTGAAHLAVGTHRSCITAPARGVMCWGSNSDGVLGVEAADICYGAIRPVEIPCSRVPIAVPGVDGGVSVAVGLQHICALIAGGQVTCWGLNPSGQLGDGTRVNSNSPVSVCSSYDEESARCLRTLSNVISLAAGQLLHTCAVTVAGGVKCWGQGAAGQLGDGTTEPRAVPVDVVGLGGKPEPTPAPPPLMGDANCDGVVTAIDAALILQFSAALFDALPCPGAADVNQDGQVTSVDAALILQFVAGLVPGLGA